MLDLAFVPDRQAGSPLHVQLARHLRDLVEKGRLPHGEKLPATRELADALGIGRNTATRAYRHLVEEGTLISHVGQGTFVNARGRASVEAEEEPLARPFAWEAMLSRAGSARLSRTLLAPHGGALPFDFRPGRVDAELLPRPVLRRAYGKVIDTQLAEIAHPNDLLGHRPLREAVARLPLGRGIIADADQLLIVGGSQSGLDLIARVLVDPGDAVGVEQPGYFVAMRMPSARRVQDWWA